MDKVQSILGLLNLVQKSLRCGGRCIHCRTFSASRAPASQWSVTNVTSQRSPGEYIHFAWEPQISTVPEDYQSYQWSREWRIFSTCWERPAALSQVGATTWKTAWQFRLQPLVMNMLPIFSTAPCLTAYNSSWSFGPAFCKIARDSGPFPSWSVWETVLTITWALRKTATFC